MANLFDNIHQRWILNWQDDEENEHPWLVSNFVKIQLIQTNGWRNEGPGRRIWGIRPEILTRDSLNILMEDSSQEKETSHVSSSTEKKVNSRKKKSLRWELKVYFFLVFFLVFLFVQIFLCERFLHLI